MKKYEYLIWDFNGTILDDVEASMSSVNVLLEERGLKPMPSFEFYREVFDFPIKKYYAALGFDFINEPYEVVAPLWVALYNEAVKKSNIRCGVVEMMESLKNMGVKQQSSLARKMKVNLIKNYAEIVAGLSCAGIYMPTYAQGVPEEFQTLTKPSTPEERKRTAERSRQWRKTHELTPEQKARAVQRKREWRARKRQERNAQTATK